jgi:hypothetical protein
MWAYKIVGFPSPLPSRHNKEARYPSSVPKNSVGDPSVPDSAPTKTSPWATPPRGARTDYFWRLLCLPTVPPLASDSYLLPDPLGLEGQREERLVLTLTQLLQEGFLSQLG